MAGKEAAIIPHYVGWRDSPAAPKRVNKFVLSVNPWDPFEILAWIWVLCKASLCLSCGSWGFQLQVRSTDWLFWERRYLSYRERMKNWSLDPMTSPARLRAPAHKGAWLTSSLMTPLQVRSLSFLRDPAALSNSYNLLKNQWGLSSQAYVKQTPSREVYSKIPQEFRVWLTIRRKYLILMIK